MNLARELSRNLNDISILIGARSSEGLVELDQFSSYGTVYTTTENGTHGQRGYVTDHPILRDEFGQFKRIYSCGPEPQRQGQNRYSAKYLWKIPWPAASAFVYAV